MAQSTQLGRKQCDQHPANDIRLSTADFQQPCQTPPVSFPRSNRVPLTCPYAPLLLLLYSWRLPQLEITSCPGMLRRTRVPLPGEETISTG